MIYGYPAFMQSSVRHIRMTKFYALHKIHIRYRQFLVIFHFISYLCKSIIGVNKDNIKR